MGFPSFPAFERFFALRGFFGALAPNQLFPIQARVISRFGSSFFVFPCFRRFFDQMKILQVPFLELSFIESAIFQVDFLGDFL